MINDLFPYKSILIICSVNTARSPMAEGYLSAFFSNMDLKIAVKSCGIASNARDGMLISLDAKLAMKEDGINLSETSKSRDLKKHPELLENVDLVLTLTEKHKEDFLELFPDQKADLYTLKEFAGRKGDIKDPSMKGLSGFRVARDEIKDCLFKGLRKWQKNIKIDDLKKIN